MGSNVGNVRYPGLVWLKHVKLPLQMIRRHHRWRSAAFPLALAVSCLGAQTRCAHDTVNAIDTASLAQDAQIVRDLAIAVERAAFQP